MKPIPARRYPYSQVDAFTRERLQGNPCAVVLEADDLTESEMLAIAREMNLSETSFVLRSLVADFRFRFFTPAEEIPLAGHPTIATVYRLLELGLIPSTKTTLQIELVAGIIEVRVEAGESGPLIVMKQLAPKFLKTYLPTEILPLFGLDTQTFNFDLPIQTVSTGTPMLMIPVKDKSMLSQVKLNSAGFLSLRRQSDFFSAHLFAVEGGKTFARHFCPPPDLVEDPFTGSATGAMGCYLWRYNLISLSHFTAYQGSHLQRPGSALVKVYGERENILAVEVAGHAITCLEGELII